MTSENSETTAGMVRRRILKGAAAAGLTGTALTGTASAHPKQEKKTLTIQALGELAKYKITVSGEIITQLDGDPGGEDEIINDGQTVVGTVAGQGQDQFTFTGEVVSIEFPEGNAKVLVNGEPVTLDERLSNKIIIKAQGEFVRYKFKVTGEVDKGPRAEGDDRVKEPNVVVGAVGNQGVDTYRYSGAITFFEEDGPLRVILDINPAADP